MTDHERILAIVRRSLKRGQRVEIDGLGSFQPAADGGHEFRTQSEPQVFIAYVKEDLAPVRRLCDGIAAAGCATWLDKDKLLPGQDWPRAIRRAVEISDAFVACFSPRSIVKRGQFHNELRWALENSRLRPLGTTFLVPVRLEPCAVPRQIRERVQYVDLFPDWEAGIRKVVRAVRAARKPGFELVQT